MTILDSAAEAILTVDLSGRVVSANPAATRLFATPGDQIVGYPLSDLLDPDDPLTELLTEDPGLPVGSSLTGVRADGSTFGLELTISRVDLGFRQLATVVARDVSERLAFEQRLTRLGTHDPLTGLANRSQFLERLGAALASGQRTGRPVAVLTCDLDRFKVINDSLGHAVGDALLMATADRLHATVQRGDTVARLGGDEFGVLLEHLDDPSEASSVADALIAALAEPFLVQEHQLHVTTSVGIAHWRPEEGPYGPESLVRDADVAMHRAKSKGPSSHELFDAELHRLAVERLETESLLRHSVVDGRIRVHFQPEVSLSSGEVVGLEALVRWEHPVDGLVSPSSFLAVAEETGLIVPIGAEVLSIACAEAANWHLHHGGSGPPPTVWVNVSARQLADPGFVDVVDEAVHTWLPSHAFLGLEITETDAVPDDDDSRETVAALRRLGVRLAIDDFGTGFASLAYLWRFPADVIKIDQSFVQRLDDDRDAAVLVRAMIEMTHSLGKAIVAEGVETESQLEQLRAFGCDAAQGYLLARPMPAADLAVLLAT